MKKIRELKPDEFFCEAYDMIITIKLCRLRKYYNSCGYCRNCKTKNKMKTKEKKNE